jgi:Nucleoside-diphosphate-sugar epimerases
VIGIGRPSQSGPIAAVLLGRQLREAAPQVVVNCAGVTQGDLVALNQSNVQLVVDLLEALEATGVHLVQIGSSAEYGASPSRRPVSEDQPARPQGPYGQSKLRATHLVLDAAGSGRVRGTVLRVFNPVGAGNSLQSLPGRAAHLLRQALADGGPVRLGPLIATRDFVDVRDVADAVAAACATPGIAGSIINVGSGRGTMARELVHLLAAAAGYVGEILEEAAGSPRSDEVPWQVADISRAAAVLGWAPARSLADAVGQLWSAAV